jgi:hypothetical protein
MNKRYYLSFLMTLSFIPSLPAMDQNAPKGHDIRFSTKPVKPCDDNKSRPTDQENR